MHVISVAGPGADLAEGAEGVALACELNDAPAKAVNVIKATLAGVGQEMKRSACDGSGR
jgi:hypothetical protein